MSAHDWPNDLGYRPPERIDLGLLNDDNLADEWRPSRGSVGIGRIRPAAVVMSP